MGKITGKVNYKSVLKGDTGYTYKPHVTTDGVLYWSNNGNLPNPLPVNIKGKNGDMAQQEEINKINDFLNDNKLKLNSFITLDIDNTGITDVTNIIQSYLNTYKKVVLPCGIYRITKLILNDGNILQGESMSETILFNDKKDGDFLISTNESCKNMKIDNITVDGKKYNNGIELNIINNPADQYDVRNYLTNITVLNTKDESITLDSNCRECRLSNILCEGGNKGITINGTDNFLNNITISNMKNYGILLKSNNKCDLLKTFLCNMESEGSSIIVNGYGVNLSNICTQQNYNNGIEINGDNCYINLISDSNGYKNKFTSYGIVCNGSYNQIIGSVIDGRLNGNLRGCLKMSVESIYNNINITFNTNQDKQYNSKCVLLETPIKNSLNNIIINGDEINTLKKEYIYFKNSTNVRFVCDAIGNGEFIGDNLEITLSEFSSIPKGYGSTFRITETLNKNYKYIIIQTSIEIINEFNKRLVIADLYNSIVEPTEKYIIFKTNKVEIIGNTINSVLILDIEKMKQDNLNEFIIWFALVKKNKTSESDNFKTIFQNAKYYYSN